MELVAGQLDAIEVAASPVGGHRAVDVDKYYQVSNQTLGGEVRYGGHLARTESAAVPLVGNRGFQVAVGNYMATLSQGRADYFHDVLGSRGGDHQRLGSVHRVIAGWVEDHVAETLPKSGASGFAGVYGAEVLGEQSGLGGLSRAVRSLDGYQ
jgi:hypothetical protein